MHHLIKIYYCLEQAKNPHNTGFLCDIYITNLIIFNRFEGILNIPNYILQNQNIELVDD
jgi:hypothetical protein